MARTNRIPKLKLFTDDQPDAELLAHVGSLGLVTVAEYVAWCARNGFSRRTAKTWRQRLKERAFFVRAVADARLAQKKKELRSPSRIIDSIFRGEVSEQEVTQPHLKAIWRARRSPQINPSAQQAFRELVLHVVQCADLLDANPVIPHYGQQEGNTFIMGLLALAVHAASWLRSPVDWKPQTHNSRRQFSSLARHLFARWPVPAFMDSVWFKGHGSDGIRQQEWFLHVGRGENLRTANLPLTYTKRMAHHFMQAPSDLTTEAALRWGQIHGLGGNAGLVRAILGTHLATTFEHDDFWITVLRFFIANPMFDTAHVRPIIDYIHHQRFVPQELVLASGVIVGGTPAQPNFTMKGRTPMSLLRQLESWHRGLAKVRQPEAEWPRSGFRGFEFVEGSEKGGNLKIWRIAELLDTKSLVTEGRLMKHCVATYVRSCSRGRCSIWTLEIEVGGGRSKALTIEVNNAAKLICQARGKRNAVASEKERSILRRWAEQAGLIVAGYL